jgi:hypothetical protein
MKIFFTYCVWDDSWLDFTNYLSIREILTKYGEVISDENIVSENEFADIHNWRKSLKWYWKYYQTMRQADIIIWELSEISQFNSMRTGLLILAARFHSKTTVLLTNNYRINLLTMWANQIQYNNTEELEKELKAYLMW